MKKILLTLSVFTSFLLSNALAGGFAETNLLLEKARKEAGEMEPKRLKQMLDKEQSLIVLDIREAEQRAEGEIYADESYAITRGNLEFEILNKVKNKNAIIVTYCRTGGRGALAAQTLRHLGFVNATNLKGGLKAWAEHGYPIETGLGVTLLTKEEE